MAPLDPIVVLDDRLLIEEILAGLEMTGTRYTTTSWYYRACRAAVAGAGGHLSGPFLGLGHAHQAAAIRSLLTLPDAISIADPRSTVPAMAELAERHPRLNLLNLEAAATAFVLNATVLLSAESARGILPAILDSEQVAWRAIKID